MRAPKTIGLLLAPLLAACGAQLRADYRPSGAPAAAGQAVSSPEAVKVHFGLLDGFALRDGELVVESGFEHRVLGFIQVVYDRGMCDSSRANKSTVVGLLQREAFARGANAVVLASSKLKEKPGSMDVCSILGRPYGVGWAVVAAGGAGR
jgi:hypothetical protein